jgi:acetyl-CoA carboxylase carboxyltransferase component
MDKAKELLALFPLNNKEKPPRVSTEDDPERTIPELDESLPERTAAPYDMMKILIKVVDDAYFFESMKDHAKNVMTGFARFNGRVAGIVASQPKYMAGVLDCDTADKVARFVRFCDLFNIPLINFHDTPGFLIGSEQDWRGILRHGAKMLYCYADATVPLVAVIVRKSYAGAHYAMCDKSIGADFVFAWPTALTTAVGAETAASVIFAKEIAKAENPEEVRQQRIQEYRELYEHPYHAAARGYVDDVIMPHDTSKYINRALDILENKTVSRPWRKYSNINL